MAAKIKVAIRDCICEMNWWDKIFLFLYIVVFGSIGILMSKGIIPYATNFSELLSNLKGFSSYMYIFGVISASNFILTLVLFFNDEAAVRLLKKRYRNSYDYDYNDIEKIIGSIISFFIALIINVVLFPMFSILYGLICIAVIVFIVFIKN